MCVDVCVMRGIPGCGRPFLRTEAVRVRRRSFGAVGSEGLFRWFEVVRQISIVQGCPSDFMNSKVSILCKWFSCSHPVLPFARFSFGALGRSVSFDAVGSETSDVFGSESRFRQYRSVIDALVVQVRAPSLAFIFSLRLGESLSAAFTLNGVLG